LLKKANRRASVSATGAPPGAFYEPSSNRPGTRRRIVLGAPSESQSLILRMITIAFLLTLILFGISIIKSCQMFDRIIQREHDVYNKYWIMDGKPVGFFWHSNETVRPFDRIAMV
jgi:hypothetical protein